MIRQEVAAVPSSSLALEAALGTVLAEEIVCTADSPPFDKSMMDGFALRSDDVNSGRRELAIVGELTAGRTSDYVLQPGEAIRIMTGAPIPAGVDAVVKIEETRVQDGRVRLLCDSVVTRANIVRQGESMRRGEQLLTAGTRLRPQEIGLLSELGHASVRVCPRPRITVLATGDELVPLHETPGPGQIRNSNEPMLCAQIEAAGGVPVPLGIARDNVESLREKITTGLDADFLCLSGGVSAGKLDLVPAELQRAGVREVFHKVEMKPGKPVWFGKLPGDRPRYIFGLPGNPVSSMVCFELFLRLAIRCWQGETAPELPFRLARLVKAFESRSDRPVFFPAQLSWQHEYLQVEPTNWQGSFDLRATVQANALAFFESAGQFPAGATVRVFPLGSTALAEVPYINEVS